MCPTSAHQAGLSHSRMCWVHSTRSVLSLVAYWSGNQSDKWARLKPLAVMKQMNKPAVNNKWRNVQRAEKSWSYQTNEETYPNRNPNPSKEKEWKSCSSQKNEESYCKQRHEKGWSNVTYEKVCAMQRIAKRYNSSLRLVYRFKRNFNYPRADGADISRRIGK